ncbi:MAG: heat shock protein HspQ [Pseudomonadota bacterium]
MSRISTALFSIGDIVYHQRFDYRGVVIDIDAEFSLSERWYESMARSRPPKDAPWYHVLVDQGTHQTYVAERNLGPDTLGEPISHPAVMDYFTDFVDGRYISELKRN